MTQVVGRTATHLIVRDLVKMVPTGRGWGNKIEEKRRGDIVENDAWEGPTAAGESGQYFRCVWRERKVALSLTKGSDDAQLR